MNVIPFPSGARSAGRDVDSAPDTLCLPVAPQAVCRLLFAPEAKAVQPLFPTEALAEVARHPGLARVELTGPGDPLATMAATLETLALLKERHPNLSVRLTSLGLGGEEAAPALAMAGLAGITLLIDTLDATTAMKIYAWIRPGKKTLPLPKAVELLLDQQARAVRALAEVGVGVTIRTTLYPGLNAHQAVTIAETMAQLGAAAMELLPYPGPQRENDPPPATRTHMEQISRLTGQFLATTFHQIPVEDCGCDCGPRCGTGSNCGCSAALPVQTGLPQPSAERPRVAVASATGMDVDLHLGQAKTLLIYGPREDGLTCLLEARQTPEPGSGEQRWAQLADILPDCFALLAASAGLRPREVLAERGIRVLLTGENIEGTVDVLYGGGKKQKCKK